MRFTGIDTPNPIPPVLTYPMSKEFRSMITPVQFGASTVVIQGAQYQGVAKMALQFAPPNAHVTVGPVLVDGDCVKFTVTGPAKGAVGKDDTDFNYDPEANIIATLTTMLKVAQVPMSGVTVESADRPDLVTEFGDRFSA